MALFAWIEGWYDPQRRYPSIGYPSPTEFGRRHAERETGGSAPRPPSLYLITQKGQEGPGLETGHLSTEVR